MQYCELSFREYIKLTTNIGSYKVLGPGKIVRWFKNGNLHRDNDPAVIRSNDTLFWYKNGRLHRTDGPAEMCADGDIFYHLNGRIYSKEEWFNKLTPEQKAVALTNPENF